MNNNQTHKLSKKEFFSIFNNLFEHSVFDDGGPQKSEEAINVMNFWLMLKDAVKNTVFSGGDAWKAGLPVPKGSIAERGKLSTMYYPVLCSASLVDGELSLAIAKFIEYYNAIWTLQVLQISPFGRDVGEILDQVAGDRVGRSYEEVDILKQHNGDYPAIHIYESVDAEGDVDKGKPIVTIRFDVSNEDADDQIDLDDIGKVVDNKNPNTPNDTNQAINEEFIDIKSDEDRKNNKKLHTQNNEEKDKKTGFDNDTGTADATPQEKIKKASFKYIDLQTGMDIEFRKTIAKLSALPTTINVTLYPSTVASGAKNYQSIKLTLTIKANATTIARSDAIDILSIAKSTGTPVGKKLRRIMAKTKEMGTLNLLVKQQDIVRRNKRLLHLSGRCPVVRSMLMRANAGKGISSADALLRSLQGGTIAYPRLLSLNNDIYDRWRDTIRNHTLIPTCSLICTLEEFEEALGVSWASVIHGRNYTLLMYICNSMALLSLGVVDFATNMIYLKYSGYPHLIMLTIGELSDVIKASRNEDKQMDIIKTLASRR